MGNSEVAFTLPDSELLQYTYYVAFSQKVESLREIDANHAVFQQKMRQ